MTLRQACCSNGTKECSKLSRILRKTIRRQPTPTPNGDGHVLHVGGDHVHHHVGDALAEATTLSCPGSELPRLAVGQAKTVNIRMFGGLRQKAEEMGLFQRWFVEDRQHRMVGGLGQCWRSSPLIRIAKVPRLRLGMTRVGVIRPNRPVSG